MKNEIAKTEAAGLPVVGAGVPQQTVLSTDIIIPQLLLMQGLSEFIIEKKKCSVSNVRIETGMFVRSTTVEVLGGEEKPVQIIPLKMVANWKIEERIGDKFEYRKTISRNASNENLEWNYKENGTDWRRVKVLDVFALLPQDILAYQAEMKKLVETGEMPNLNKTLMPVMIRFKSTGFKAGMAVNTFYAQVQDLQRYKPDLKPHHFTLTLEAKVDSNDDGTFHVFKIGSPAPLAKEMVVEADRWALNMASRTDFKVDEAADSDAPRAQAGSQF